jgi:hypothetical protein
MMEKRNAVAIPSVLADEVEDSEVRWTFHRLQHSPLDRLGFLRWGPVAAANLVL